MPTGCEVLFDREQAEAMQGLVEGATGHPCPCKTGATCPLLPATGVGLTLRMRQPVADLAGMVALVAATLLI